MAGAPNFANRTMWTRDNLDILRGLNSESIDLVYADPPFNSNKNYEAPIGSKAAGAAFKDTWTLSDVDLAWHGEIAEREPKVYAAIDNAGMLHGPGMKSYLIMMAVRLLEVRRVLKPSGALLLHCDPTADAYLRILLDVIFGASNFRNEIVWKRTFSNARGARKVAAIHDVLLLYAASPTMVTNAVYTAHDPAYVAKFYRFEDEHGRYQPVVLTAPGTTNGDSGKPWRGTDPGDKGRHWSSPTAFPAHVEKPEDWEKLTTRQKLDRLEALGLILWPKTGSTPRFKRYLSTSAGQPMTDMVLDVPPLSHAAKERVGYPTQKPLALLDRLIKTASDEGEVVLDPFCGCATACVSAESLGRQWIGIDLSPVAATLVESRLHDQFGIFAEIHHRTDIPRRTDLGNLPNYRTHKHALFGKQEGHCAGCRIMFPFRNFEIDHVIPRAKGGSEHVDNLQLLCGACNRAKGTGTQAELIAKLRDRGQLAA